MAEFNDPAGDTFNYWATPKEKVATPPEDLDVLSMRVSHTFHKPTQRPIPQVNRLNRALAVLPFLIVAVIVLLLLAGCKDDGRARAGTRSTTGQTQQTGNTAASVQSALNTVARAVSSVLPGDSSESQSRNNNGATWTDTGPAVVDVPTPSMRSTCPHATYQEITDDLNADGPMVCVSATREAAK